MVILADKIPWVELEKEFSGYYSDTGQPSKPVRLQSKKDLRKREVIIDRTVQEKNNTFPKHAKLYQKIVD